MKNSFRSTQKIQHSQAVMGTTGLIALLGLTMFQSVKAQTLLDVMPAPMTFRAFDNLSYPSTAFTDILSQQAPFPFVHGPGIGVKAVAVKNAWPNKIVTIQAAYGGIGQNNFASVWPGHLLYKKGTLTSKDISASDQTITVKLPSVIATNNVAIDAVNAVFPFALTIYALDATGKPDWSKAEHVILQSINGSTLTVQRGQWGTTPLDFKAGKAVVAAHMKFWTRQWQLNFSLHCPRGGVDNLTAAEWFARREAQVVSDSNADGIEFDVARWTWGFSTANPMDINNDLVADYGYIDGVNSFGLGGQVFFRELRRLLGPDKIIQADSNDAQTGMRGWQYLNGVQLESFPDANDFTRFSQAFGHLRLWVDNAKSTPRVSYPFTKTPTTLYAGNYLPNGGNTDFRFRIGFASACLTGMPHPFASLSAIAFDPSNPSNVSIETFGVFPWDEYHGGDLNNWQWLGRPLTSAIQDLSNVSNTNLLAASKWKWALTKGFTATSTSLGQTYTANVTKIPPSTIPDKLLNGVKLMPTVAVNLIAGHEYTIEFDAQGGDVWNTAGQTFTQVPRMVTISGAVLTGARNHPLSVLVDSTPRHYRVSFIADGTAAGQFGVSEQIGQTQISNVKLYAGGAERWSREFENGRVLLNMTLQPWTVSMSPNTYRYLKGAQNPDINNGQVVGQQVIVPAQDAVFLVKQ